MKTCVSRFSGPFATVGAFGAAVCVLGQETEPQAGPSESAAACRANETPCKSAASTSWVEHLTFDLSTAESCVSHDFTYEN